MWDLDHKECQMSKNWCFQTVVLEKTLESPFDSKEIKPVNPKGNQPWYSLEGLLLKLKLQYSGHLMRRADSMEKTLMLGKTESRRRGWQRVRWSDGITDSMDMSLSKLWKIGKGREVQRAAVHGVTKSRTSPSNWTIIIAEGALLCILPFSKTPSASRTETVRFAAIFNSSAFTVTCEGLCSRSSTPMVTFPPGLMIPGTVTRNLGLKSFQQQEKNEVAYPYIFILLRFSNFIDGEIDSLFSVNCNCFNECGPTAPFSNCIERLLKEQSFP